MQKNVARINGFGGCMGLQMFQQVALCIGLSPERSGEDLNEIKQNDSTCITGFLLTSME